MVSDDRYDEIRRAISEAAEDAAAAGMTLAEATIALEEGFSNVVETGP